MHHITRAAPPIPEGASIPAGGVYRVAVTPADVGSRVTVRRAVEGGVADVVGELLSWSDGVLSVRRRDGAVVPVAEADVVAARVIPPPPPGALRRPT